MDSLGLFMKLNPCTNLQIAKIYRLPQTDSKLKIQKLAVQQQQGTLECGCFAIANAVEICFGVNPEIFCRGTLKLILCCGVLHARLLPSGYCNGNSGAHVQGGRQLDLTSR